MGLVIYMHSRFSYERMENDDIKVKEDIISDAIKLDSDLKNDKLIGIYNNQIANYNQDKKIFSDLIMMIDLIVEKLNAVNLLMEEVIISGKQYDDDFLENTIADLLNLRGHFSSFVVLCNNEISRLDSCICSLQGGN